MTPAIITLGTYPSSRVSNETTHQHSQNHMPSLTQDNSNKPRNTDLDTGEGTGKIRIRAYKTEYGQTPFKCRSILTCIFFILYYIFSPDSIHNATIPSRVPNYGLSNLGTKPKPGHIFLRRLIMK